MNLRGAISLEELNEHSARSAAGYCGIRVEHIGDTWIEVSMPVNETTQGPEGALTLGALSILAESVGSLASTIALDRSRYACVGQTLQVNQLNRTRTDHVRATARPIHVSDSRHLWQIDIVDADKVTIASAQLTTVIQTLDDPPRNVDPDVSNHPPG